jgi:hypothetical protein
MIAGTALGIFFVPIFFVAIRKVFRSRRSVPPDAEATTIQPAHDH